MQDVQIRFSGLTVSTVATVAPPPGSARSRLAAVAQARWVGCPGWAAPGECRAAGGHWALAGWRGCPGIAGCGSRQLAATGRLPPAQRFLRCAPRRLPNPLRSAWAARCRA